MRSMEFSGRTVDEAIFHGLQEMGVTIDEVIIETLQTETKGLFGFGSKMAVVRLTEREIPVEPDFEEMRRESAPAPREDRQPREPRERRSNDRRDRGPRSGSRRSNDRRDRGPRSGSDRVRDRQAEIDAALEEDNRKYNYSKELTDTDPAAQFLKELLEKMGMPSDILAAETDDGLRLRIETDTNGVLIGRRGETLDALQYIVSLYANRDSKDYRRITLDTEGYRSRREETLGRLARKAASEVRATGRSVAMEPMNPYERRVIHSALQNFDGVTTHSEGEEPNRRIIISPVEEEY